MHSTSNKLLLLLALLLCLAGRGFAATAIGSITVTGAEQSAGGTWDTGTVTAKINGVSVSIAYGQWSTPASIASGLAAMISQKCSSQVYAKAAGTTISFYKRGTNVLSSASLFSTSSNPTLFPSTSFVINGVGTWSAPVIAGLSMPEGPPLMGLVISGTGFGTSQGASTVTIGGITASVIPGTWSDTRITVQVPSGITLGGVAVISSGFISATYPFQVDQPFGCN
jgi:hypothetical protein